MIPALIMGNTIVARLPRFGQLLHPADLLRVRRELSAGVDGKCDYLAGLVAEATGKGARVVNANGGEWTGTYLSIEPSAAT